MAISSITPLPGYLSIIIAIGFAFFGGFWAAIKLADDVKRTSLGCGAILLVFVVDLFVASLYLEHRGEYSDISSIYEVIFYGIIALGWLVGAGIGGLSR
jgi:hypothetical protein